MYFFVFSSSRFNQTFQHLAILGEQLVQLHLLKSKLLDNPQSHYEGKGDDRVEKRDYHSDSKRLYINSSQYFDKVAPEVWNYFIGGYQVLDKWLKDRNGMVLSLDDQLHFRRVISALTQTIVIQKRIDNFYLNVEESYNVMCNLLRHMGISQNPHDPNIKYLP